MKSSFSMLLILALSLGAGLAMGQDKSEKANPAVSVVRDDATQLKVQLVFNEFSGDKKVKSLPYTLLVGSGPEGRSKLRMGSRVPVATGGEKTSYQYIDVGTNIDCWATPLADGRYRVTLTMERSWAEGEGSADDRKPAPESKDLDYRPAVVRQFRSEMNVPMHDGQTVEADFATDPITGKVIRLEVTLTVIK